MQTYLHTWRRALEDSSPFRGPETVAGGGTVQKLRSICLDLTQEIVDA